MIFFSLSIQTLENVRLVCRSFHYAAERLMFRELLLLPNAESFTKLRKISEHARLKGYVKSLVYSGKILKRYKDYEDWYDHLGRDYYSSLDDDFEYYYEYRRAMSCLRFDEEELKQRYARYCFWAESGKQVQLNDNASRWMSEALSMLPNLASMTLARRHEPNWVGIKVKLLGRIAQESLCEPNTTAGIKHYPDQFGDLVRAAHASNVSLQRLDGSGICWRGFEDYSDSLARIMQGVKHLFLQFRTTDGASKERRDILRGVVHSTSGLQTLEISFYFIRSPPMQLSQFLPRHMLWSSLKRLKLEAIATSQVALMDLLSRHAKTLRSLYLGHILFDRREARDGICAGSWTAMIHFLRQKLSLTDVSLHGMLSNAFDEGWEASTERWWRYQHFTTRNAQLPSLEETLKFKVERYIVEGGICPLDNPNDDGGLDRCSFWHSIRDYSWQVLYF